MLTHRPLLLVVGIWIACVTTECGTVNAAPTSEDARGTTFTSEPVELDSGIEMVDVTPQIPDGPVVQAYQKLVEKQKLDAEVARQKKMMGPVMDRGDAKKKAKKKELEMLAEVEIKNRLGKKELALKKKDKEDVQAERARTEAANARRLERYEKWSQDEVKRNHERLSKLHDHTKGAFSLAKRLFKRKKGSKKTAVKSKAEAVAEQSKELRVGGFLELRGDQINFRQLVALNDKISKAMHNPSDENIQFVQSSFDAAAKAVADEQAGFEQKENGWKEKDKKIKDEKEAKQIERHNKKLDELALKVAKEQQTKKLRKSRIEQDRITNEISEKGKWKAVYDDIKKKREDILASERKAKDDFTKKIAEQAAEKKEKAPGELVALKKKKYQERSEKYDSSRNSDESTAYVAKQMKIRACEEYAHANKQLAEFQSGGGRRLLHAGEPPSVEGAEKQSAKCKNG